MIVIAATKRGFRSGIDDALVDLPSEAGNTTIKGEREEVWRYVNSKWSVRMRC
jgi:hypothetical protein